MRRALERLVLLALGGVATLVLLEGGLQLAALVWETGSRSVAPSARSRGEVVRVLCLGDSNTYGLRLAPEESYPAQLERLWSERVGSPKLEVVNLGYPGTNSSRLVRDLPELLDRLAPDVVVLMVGVNDPWTREFTLEERENRPLWRRITDASRVRRLYWLLRARFDSPLALRRDPRPVPDEGPMRMQVGDRSFDVSYERAQPGEHGTLQALLDNLVRLVDLGRARGSEVVLMTYPARNDFYSRVSRVIRRAARETASPFVDLEESFRPLCPEKACPELLFADGHPKAAGYRVLAETLVEELSGRYGR